MNSRPVQSYLVCATPRSGSTLLCEALGSTDLAGPPAEYFLPKDDGHWCREWDVKGFEAFVDRALAAGSTPNGVFGAKVMWGYFDAVVGALSSSTLRASRLCIALPRPSALWPTHRRTVPRAGWSEGLVDRLDVLQ